MLQRTRVHAVFPVWQEFAQLFPTPEDLLHKDQLILDKVMRSLGLQWRARLIRELAEALVKRDLRYTDKRSLMALPCVGDYISSAMLSLFLERRAVIIDSNVVRWISRMTGNDYDGETRRKGWFKEIADTLTPITTFRDYNYGVLDFTMTVCTQLPNCNLCPVSSYCQYNLSLKAAVESEGYGFNSTPV
tara:strand:+ start:1316 stop:1882 length:567 start_codon:yes stop_codon:yes gene_type:complete